MGIGWERKATFSFHGCVGRESVELVWWCGVELLDVVSVLMVWRSCLLLGSSKDVIMASALISAFERAGEWERALCILADLPAQKTLC